MLKPYWVDLHVHTTLSPCGELEMGAPEIVEAARAAGIDILAIADHNICDNFPAVSRYAAGNPVVLPAIEVQTAEDIHVLSLFADYETASVFQEWLWMGMPSMLNDPDIFGYQVVIDENNEVVRMEDVLLIQGVSYDVDTIVSRVHDAGGLVVLAHVDRPAFAYPAVLGPIPQDYAADAFELSWRLDSTQAEEWRTRYPGRAFIRSSDAHELVPISRAHATKMLLAEPTLAEIRLALGEREGRHVSWPWG